MLAVELSMWEPHAGLRPTGEKVRYMAPHASHLQQVAAAVMSREKSEAVC